MSYDPVDAYPDLGKTLGVLDDEQPSDASLREFVGCAIRSPSPRMLREGMFVVPEPKPEDLFLTIDPNAFPELSDETMRRIVEQVQPIIDEYFRNAEQMAQRCFIVPMPVDLAKTDPAKPLEPKESGDWPW